MTDIVERLRIAANELQAFSSPIENGKSISFSWVIESKLAMHNATKDVLAAANEISSLLSSLEEWKTEAATRFGQAQELNAIANMERTRAEAAEKALADARIEIDAMRKKAIENARERNAAEVQLKEAAELIRPFGESDIIDLADFKMLTDSHCIGGYCTDFTIGDLRAAAAFLAKVTP